MASARLLTILISASILAHAHGQDLTGCSGSPPALFCFGLPPNCERGQGTCSVLFKAVYDATARQLIADIFTATSGMGRYIGVALSRDNVMGLDSVAECAHMPDGTVTMRHGSTTARDDASGLRYVPDRNGIAGVTTVMSTISNGIMHCRWTRNSATIHMGQDWTLAGNNFWLLFAQGAHDASGVPLYHGVDSRSRFGSQLAFPL